MESTHWRLQLNNALQKSYGVTALTWEQNQLGPQHAGRWEAVALIRYTPYGKGQGSTMGEAKEAAARIAYDTLLVELARGKMI
ncbi:hypothetical protein EUX98_g9077 [Antrodiella citrinella]|uniref:DRBM domain-containing protein n=1 Tax=Antrodiella citrinella TaxID=2447956 RepID=A0A4S4LYP7_9APHY|nr:hypothetical protein EUX98_g9077 [Antrodiella citrinella]